MKMTNLEKLRNSLRENIFEVKVPERIAKQARIPLERMLAIK
jgi:quinolinate synthase